MFNLMKPGHVLRFGTSPSTIISPPGAINPSTNNNTLATAWTAASDLGLVQCLSHPSGAIGPIAAEVATRLRGGFKLSRAASYSAPGRFLTPANRAVGATQPCHFVGYVDGRSNYIQSTQTVFSKDFSGCLMVVYNIAGQRHVAHAAASQVATMNCKQPFLTTIQGLGATLVGGGWFRPFVDVRDTGRKINTHNLVNQYYGGNINNLVTFGVVTNANQAYSIDAFKPTGVGGNDWVVTDVTAYPLTATFVAP